MRDGNELYDALRNFTGSENWYKHGFTRSLYTDGAKCFFDNAGRGAYWLLDIIATQPEIVKTMKDYGFAVIGLYVGEDHTAEIVVDDGDGNVTYRRELTFTDCPVFPAGVEGVNCWRLWVVDNVINNVIMLPSEY